MSESTIQQLKVVVIKQHHILLPNYFLVALNANRDQPLIASASQLNEAQIQLQSKLKNDQCLATWLSTDATLSGFVTNDEKKIFIIPEQSAPKEVHLAHKILNQYIDQKIALAKIEYPMIPWEKPSIQDHLGTLKTYPHLQHLYRQDHPDVVFALKKINRRKKILLHVCCGPDAAGVINQLKRDFDVVCFWYDPNIQPKDEYDLRLKAFEQVADIEKIPYVVGEYDTDRFFELIKGLEHTPEQGAKCSICYDMRLERSALEAKALDCDYFATTLAISPHKVQEKLKRFGEISGQRHQVEYFHKNFMKDEGFKKSVEYTRDYNIYRQDYCGCLYSLHEGGANAQKLAKQLNLRKEDLVKQL